MASCASTSQSGVACNISPHPQVPTGATRVIFLPSIFMAAVRARPAAIKVPDRLLALIIFLCCPLLVQMESRLQFKT